jgi:CRISPR-associated protein Cas2
MDKLYQEVIVSYDIEDNKNRTQLFKNLKAMSLISIQKSVFWGHLKIAEEKAVKRLFKKYCDTCDKAFIVRVKLSQTIKDNSVGYKVEKFPTEPQSYEVL